MQLHATLKLMSKLHPDAKGFLPATERSQWLFDKPPPDVNPLAVWQGHLFTLQRRNCVLLVNELTRFPVFMPNLAKLDFQEFNDRFIDAFINTLLKSGADDSVMNAAHSLLGPFQVDTQSNRSTMGTLNRMRSDTEHMLRYDQVNVADITGYRVGAWLADRPCSAKGRGFLWPRRKMLELLGGIAGASRQPLLESESLPANVASLAAFRQKR